MPENDAERVPQSPEVQPPAVREQLHQDNMTHRGTEERVRAGGPAEHLGADETEVTPIVPPMRGPGNLVGGTAPGEAGANSEDDDLIDPADEITPG